MSTLFDQKDKEKNEIADLPLAERMRPQSLKDFIGQEEIIGEDKPLRRAILRDELQSVILWGPPGSGKTTLAYLIAKLSQAHFEPFLAVTSGVNELRKVIKEAELRKKVKNQKTILFVDEIHRFNKAQQDAFLPFVEKGTVILIGATTENPSFDIISPLLSRSLILILRPLKDKEIYLILERALKDKERGFGQLNINYQPETLMLLAQFANGDARVALNTLEFIVKNSEPDKNNQIKLDVETINSAFSRKILRYDKKGEEHYNLISAFIKSMRDSNPDAALYWLARMLEAGEDPRFIARRMIIFASEDISNADPKALLIALSAAQAVEYVGLPEAQINLSQAATYLATAVKDNASYRGLLLAKSDVEKYGNLAVPLHLRNPVTKLMKKIGYGQGYKYPHHFPGHITDQKDLDLPPQLRGRKYYEPRSDLNPKSKNT